MLISPLTPAHAVNEYPQSPSTWNESTFLHRPLENELSYHLPFSGVSGHYTAAHYYYYFFYWTHFKFTRGNSFAFANSFSLLRLNDRNERHRQQKEQWKMKLHRTFCWQMAISKLYKTEVVRRVAMCAMACFHMVWANIGKNRLGKSFRWKLCARIKVSHTTWNCSYRVFYPRSNAIGCVRKVGCVCWVCVLACNVGPYVFRYV